MLAAIWSYDIERSFFQEVAPVNSTWKNPSLTNKKKVLALKAPWAMTAMHNGFIQLERKKKY